MYTPIAKRHQKTVNGSWYSFLLLIDVLIRVVFPAEMSREIRIFSDKSKWTTNYWLEVVYSGQSEAKGKQCWNVWSERKKPLESAYSEYNHGVQLFCLFRSICGFQLSFHESIVTYFLCCRIGTLFWTHFTIWKVKTFFSSWLKK